MEYNGGRIGEDIMYGIPINDLRRMNDPRRTERTDLLCQAFVAGTLLATVAGIIGYAHQHRIDRPEPATRATVEQTYGGR